MKTYSKEELHAILKAHQLWLSGDASGKRANLYGTNLEGANLEGANLEKADLKWANLYRANLEGANLKGANLEGANLYRANLYRANLYMANLEEANLYRANLYMANLYMANLEEADLEGANLEKADFEEANLEGANLLHFKICPEEGDFVAWKKVSGGVVKLLIPKEAKRTSSLVGRKCRAEFVVVLDGSGVSNYDSKTTYVQGATVYPDKYDDDIRIECTNGIHFFMTKREAEEH